MQRTPLYIHTFTPRDPIISGIPSNSSQRATTTTMLLLVHSFEYARQVPHTPSPLPPSSSQIRIYKSHTTGTFKKNKNKGLDRPCSTCRVEYNSSHHHPPSTHTHTKKKKKGGEGEGEGEGGLKTQENKRTRAAYINIGPKKNFQKHHHKEE